MVYSQNRANIIPLTTTYLSFIVYLNYFNFYSVADCWNGEHNPTVRWHCGGGHFECAEWDSIPDGFGPRYCAWANRHHVQPADTGKKNIFTNLKKCQSLNFTASYSIFLHSLKVFRSGLLLFYALQFYFICLFIYCTVYTVNEVIGFPVQAGGGCHFSNSPWPGVIYPQPFYSVQVPWDLKVDYCFLLYNFN